MISDFSWENKKKKCILVDKVVTDNVAENNYNFTCSKISFKSKRKPKTFSYKQYLREFGVCRPKL